MGETDPQPTSLGADYSEYRNERLIKHNKIFSIIWLILQLSFIALYGVFVKTTAVQSYYYVGLYEATGVALLVLIGNFLLFI